MRKLYLFMILLGSVAPLSAQSWFSLTQPLSLAGTSATDNRRQGLFQNPALAAGLASPLLYAEYERRYDITELASKGLRFSYPFSHFTSSIDLRYSGFSAYHEILTGLGFARDFGGKFSLGLQFILDTRYAVESDAYYSSFYPQIGLCVPLTPNLLLAVTVINPYLVQIKYETDVRSLPSVYSMGLKLRISDAVDWRLQADQEISNKLRWGTAIDCSWFSSILLQVGVQYSGFFVPGLGAGFRYRKMQFDLTTGLHPLLGLTIAGGVSYQIN